MHTRVSKILSKNIDNGIVLISNNLFEVHLSKKVLMYLMVSGGRNLKRFLLFFFPFSSLCTEMIVLFC